MVVNSKDSISPSLAKRLAGFAKKNGLSISKGSVEEALSFLANHTDVPESVREDIVIRSIMSVHKKGAAFTNYEGDEEVDPTAFGKQVVMVCSGNGIKIKRVPAETASEVKDKYDGFDNEVLDNAYVILDMQPDLDKQDKNWIVVESVLDTLNSQDSFTGGNFNYEYFAQNLKENINHIRSAKKAENAVDHLMDIFVKDDSYEGELEAALDHYDGLYNLTEDDFEDYLDDSIFGEENFHGEDDYDGFGKKKAAKSLAKAQAVKANIVNQMKERAATVQGDEKVALDKAIAKQESTAIRSKKEINKEKRKKIGGKIANVLTGGVSGAAKKIKEKNLKKKAKRTTDAALADQKKKEIDQQIQADQSAAATAAPAADVINIGTSLQAGAVMPGGMEWAGDAAAKGLPEPITGMNPPLSGGGGGGGGGGDPMDMGQAAEEEPGEEESSEEVEPGQESTEESAEESEASPEEEFWETEEEEGWMPESEDNEEIMNFFGAKKKKKVQSETEKESLYFESFTGMPESKSGKIIIALIIISIAIWAYVKYRKSN